MQATPIKKAEHLLCIAQQIAESTPQFFIALGQGEGNIRSNAFTAELRRQALRAFGRDYSEARLCGETSLAIDFYFPDEETAVEIAGMLGAPNSEYEKDIFKCILAKDRGRKNRQVGLHCETRICKGSQSTRATRNSSVRSTTVWDRDLARRTGKSGI